ncbi:MAG TPA: MFS transporter [Acidimicrobiales bacterium]|nr:MFS transporter [Acidimicrobiales bacterium]
MTDVPFRGGDDIAAPARGEPRRAGLFRRVGARAYRGIEDQFGGPARTRVILLFAAVLALNSADVATVGASATQLRQALHIGNADIGVLVAVTAIVGAIFSLPFGFVVDRANRVLVLSTTVVLWGLVMMASAGVGSFGQLVLIRAVLGAMTAATGPAVASLVGDFFPANERGKIWGYVLAGELVGAGAGFVITGDIAGISWRAAFVILALPTFPLAWALGHLPEPARGGGSQLFPGAERVIGRKDVIAAGAAPAAGEEAEPAHHPTDAQELARERGIGPDPAMVLRSDPRKMGLSATVRYVLGVRTNMILIASGACAYFFLTGVETFGLEFVKGQYHVAQFLANVLLLVVGAGAVVGVLVGGRVGDALVRRGRLDGRILVAAVAAIATAVLFIPALLSHSTFGALPYFLVAGFAMTAQNPPIDAARLDIMPPLLWGRAEGVRSLLRTGVQALAPLAFGGLSDLVGLQTTFFVMLVPFLASGLILLYALKTYPTDVATAAASAAIIDGPEGDAPPR